MNTVIFDLDGTLLPMDQDIFLNKYFQSLSESLAHYGFEPKSLIDSVFKGTKAMLVNDGKKSNENVFWDTFISIHGEKSKESIPIFEKFYEEEFDKLKTYTSPVKEARECINLLKEKNYNLILATNPLFPRVATNFRIKWAGVSPLDFSYITTYENSSFSKPNLNYYKEVLMKTKKRPEECLMIGNDLEEDMIINKLGVDTFLLTECVVNYDEEKAKDIKKGKYVDLFKIIEELPVL